MAAGRRARQAGPARRVPGVADAAGRFLVGASIVLCALLPGRQPLWRVFVPRHYQFTAFHAAGYQAVGLVPDSASVVAQAAVCRT